MDGPNFCLDEHKTTFDSHMQIYHISIRKGQQLDANHMRVVPPWHKLQYNFTLLNYYPLKKKLHANPFAIKKIMSQRDTINT